MDLFNSFRVAEKPTHVQFASGRLGRNENDLPWDYLTCCANDSFVPVLEKSRFLI